MSKQKAISLPLFTETVYIKQTWKIEFKNMRALDSILLKISASRITESKIHSNQKYIRIKNTFQSKDTED